MGFDEGAHLRKLSEWAEIRLPRYGLAGRAEDRDTPVPGDKDSAGTSSIRWTVRDGAVVQQETMAMSRDASYRVGDAGSITVTSHRPDDDRFDELRESAPQDVILAVENSWDHLPSSDPAAWDHLVWEPITVIVDGEHTDFEIMHVEAGRWAAIGRAADAHITIRGAGVPFSDMGLIRLP